MNWLQVPLMAVTPYSQGTAADSSEVQAGTSHLYANLHSATCQTALDKLFTSLCPSSLICKLEIYSYTASVRAKEIDRKKCLDQ